MIPLLLITDGARKLTREDFVLGQRLLKRFRRGTSPIMCEGSYTPNTNSTHKIDGNIDDIDLSKKSRDSDDTSPPGDGGNDTPTQTKDTKNDVQLNISQRQTNKNQTTQVLAAISGLSTIGSALAHFTDVFGEDKKDLAQYGFDFFSVLGWTLTTSSALAPKGEIDGEFHKNTVHHNIN